MMLSSEGDTIYACDNFSVVTASRSLRCWFTLAAARERVADWLERGARFEALRGRSRSEVGRRER